MCFYCTQSDILYGIAKFSRRNKNKLTTFQPQKLKKREREIRAANLKQNLLVLIYKKSVLKFESKSHIKILNEIGPKTEPYGTPNRTFSLELNDVFILVLLPCLVVLINLN